jgi:hypothetical protein
VLKLSGQGGYTHRSANPNTHEYSITVPSIPLPIFPSETSDSC